MIRLKSLSISTSAQVLLDSANGVLLDGERVGLVGENGSGKSTLLKVLNNRKRNHENCLSYHDAGTTISDTIGNNNNHENEEEESYWIITSGKIEGYMSPSKRDPDSVLLVDQDILSWSDLFPGLGSEEELREMTLYEVLDFAIAKGGEDELEDEEAWRRLCVAASEELKWNLSRYEETPLGKLSPGSALRAYLAVALNRPAVRLLLLDEPTNHLDLPSILWLQHSLMQSKKTVIVVSHDESFLDAIADRIWEIDKHNLVVSTSTYSDFVEAKLKEIEKQHKLYEEQQKRSKRLSKAAQKLRAASKVGERHRNKDNDKLQQGFFRDKAGRSGKRAKALEKMRDSEAKMDRVVEHRPLRLRLKPLEVTFDSSIILDMVELGYSAGESEPVRLPLPLISLRIEFGERVAIVGYNGIGKSTLLGTLMGEIDPISGKMSVGKQLRIGSLMQEHQSLPRDLSARTHFATVTELDPFTAGSRLIGYGLTHKQVDLPIYKLNPGARARFLLAIFSKRQANVLVLDEPTNHLDEEAVQELLASLNTYIGTVIVVSHDRKFLNLLNLNKTFYLSTKGLFEIDSLEAFVKDIEEKVQTVLEKSKLY